MKTYRTSIYRICHLSEWSIVVLSVTTDFASLIVCLKHFQSTNPCCPHTYACLAAIRSRIRGLCNCQLVTAQEKLKTQLTRVCYARPRKPPYGHYQHFKTFYDDIVWLRGSFRKLIIWTAFEQAVSCLARSELFHFPLISSLAWSCRLSVRILNSVTRTCVVNLQLAAESTG